MTEEEFTFLLPRLRPYTKFLYFHLMGEPLCHPKLLRFIELAGMQGFSVILTTNGTLLPALQEALLAAKGLHKINISLHAFEANDLKQSFDRYLDGCVRFAKAAEGKLLVSLRLWNQGGQDQMNDPILKRLHETFPEPWFTERKGIRIGQRIYLEHGDKFDWPDLNAPHISDRQFCYGLRDQIGILSDGTVVPCCLDHDGDIALGNLFRDELSTILRTERAENIYNGFSSGIACEELCRRCGYATRFQK